jgi:hypothetical protein
MSKKLHFQTGNSNKLSYYYKVNNKTTFTQEEINDMKLDEIKEIAKQHNIKIGKMKKSELIQAIQQAENNDVCFNIGKSSTCGQDACLWREDCA